MTGDSEERYYAKEVYVCLECGDRWDTPGAAQICHKKDRIMELAEQIDDHRHWQLDEVIEFLEEYVDGGGDPEA